MVRTIVALSADDKRWLDHYSHLQGQPMAQVIRLALKEFKQHAAKPLRAEALRRSAGILKRGERDSVSFVRRLRDEWELDSTIPTNSPNRLRKNPFRSLISVMAELIPVMTPSSRITGISISNHWNPCGGTFSAPC